MGKTIYRYRSSLNAAARCLSLALAAALALALGIGANGALFSIEGMCRSAGINPDAVRLLLETDFQPQAPDSAAPDESPHIDDNCGTIDTEAPWHDEEMFHCAFAHAKKHRSVIALKANTLLGGGEPTGLSFNQEGASIIPAINVKAR